MLQHKGIIHVAAFAVVGRTSTLLGVSGHTILEQTVSACSCPQRYLTLAATSWRPLTKWPHRPYLQCVLDLPWHKSECSTHTLHWATLELLWVKAANGGHSFTRWPCLPHWKHTRDSIRHVHQSVASHNKCILFSKELRATTNKLFL